MWKDFDVNKLLLYSFYKTGRCRCVIVVSSLYMFRVIRLKGGDADFGYSGQIQIHTVIICSSSKINFVRFIYFLTGLPTQIRSQQIYAGGYDDSNSEPGYESLPDQSSLSNDPGYETVVHSEAATKKDGSEYDPNYETLRPTVKYNNQPIEYAEDASGVNTGSGYSCIKKAPTVTDNNIGYASTNNRISTRYEHGYASIRENDEAQSKYEEDIYTSIPHESITLTTTLPPSTSNFSIGSDGKKMSSPSSDSDTNTSIQYNRMKGGDAIGTNSNYESSTASDSDSNYEILRHTNDKFGDGAKYPIYNEADIKYDTLKRSGSFTKHD